MRQDGANRRFTTGCQARHDLPANCLSDLALKCQQVPDVALVLSGPQLTLGPRFDQPDGDGNAVGGRPDAPLEQVAHSKVGGDSVGSFGWCS